MAKFGRPINNVTKYIYELRQICANNEKYKTQK